MKTNHRTRRLHLWGLALASLMLACVGNGSADPTPPATGTIPPPGRCAWTSLNATDIPFGFPVADNARNRVLVIAMLSGFRIDAVSLRPPYTRTTIQPEGNPPPPDFSAQLVLDEAHRRVLAVGTVRGTVDTRIFALSIGPTLRWSELPSTGPFPHPTIITPDGSGNRLHGFGSSSSDGIFVSPAVPSLAWSGVGTFPAWIGTPRGAVWDARRNRALVWFYRTTSGDDALWAYAPSPTPSWAYIGEGFDSRLSVYDRAGDAFLRIGALDSGHTQLWSNSLTGGGESLEILATNAPRPSTVGAGYDLSLDAETDTVFVTIWRENYGAPDELAMLPLAGCRPTR